MAPTLAKTASKLDWLRKRPDMQTPEGIRMLRLLDTHKQDVGEKLDPLLPWITREWKRGRLHHEVDPVRADTPPSYNEDLGGVGGQHVGHLYYQDRSPDDRGWERRPLTTPTLSHWADWYDHPLGRGNLDMGSKAFQVPHMVDAISQWDQRMKEEAERAKVEEQANAPVLHEWPDGWKLQRLKPEHLDYEGDAMGHCVGGYGYEDAVRKGNTAILSLRDPSGRPHVTAELEPTKPDLARELNELSGSALGRAIPDDLREALLAHHDLVEQGFPGLGGLAHDYGYTPEQVDEAYRAWLARKDMPKHDSLNNARIVQIQGRGNEVPKPEYQQRMKDWFTTFPEAQRPNWEYPGRDIEHIGAIVPDARSYQEGNRSWGARYNEINGEPGLNDEEDWAEGGYGPHGDYGLVKPDRPINYEETLKSVVRPQSYEDMEYGWNSYEPNEMKALYHEALRRGEIPDLGVAAQRFDEHGMEAYDRAEQHEMDYNPEFPSYPGEDWEEEPDRWNEDEYGEARTPEEAKEAWQDEYQRYEQARDELANRHPHFKALGDLHKWLEPHLDKSDPSNWTYANAPEGQDFTDPATRAAHLGFQPNVGSPGLFVKQLPQGAKFMDQNGLHHEVTQTDPLRINYEIPSWRTNYESQTPQFIKLPQPPAGQTPQTFSKVTKRKPHPHFTTGQPCHCPWGASNKLAKVAGKIEWLTERGDKFSQTPEGQEALQGLQLLVRRNPKVDPLTPWIYREVKKHRIEISANGGLYYNGAQQGGPAGITHLPINHWADWFDSNSPTRRGVDVMQLSVNDLSERIKEWDEELQAKMEEENASKGQIAHKFSDGWTVRRLRDGDEAKIEGDKMGHCVGGYGDAIENGSSQIFSLRDEKNEPHATMEIEPPHVPPSDVVYPQDYHVPEHVWNEVPSYDGVSIDRLNDLYEMAHAGGQGAYGTNHTPEATQQEAGALQSFVRTHGYPSLEGGRVVQTQGKSNSPPTDEYKDKLQEFLDPHHLELFKPWWDDHMEFHPIDDVDNYLAYQNQHPYPAEFDYEAHEPEDYRWAQCEAEENGVEEPIIGLGRNGVEWNDILNSFYKHPYHSGFPGPGGYDIPWDQRPRAGSPRSYDPQLGDALTEAATKYESPETAARAAVERGKEYGSDRTYEQELDWHNGNRDRYPGEYGHLTGLRDAFKDFYDEHAAPVPFTPPREIYYLPYEERQKALRDAELQHQAEQWENIDPDYIPMLNHLGPKLMNNWQEIRPPASVSYNPPIQVAPGQTPLFDRTPTTDPAAVAQPWTRYDGQTFSRTAMISDPLYYRWVFSPASGEVTLAHNLDDDPKLHGDLAREQNEPGLVHGYAYRIGGGWRLTDWEHRPVEDPYVVAQVMRKLRDEEGYTPAEAP
jgi:hypothetical protein